MGNSTQTTKVTECFRYWCLPFSSSQGNGATCCPLSLLHSFPPLHLCPFRMSFLLAPCFQFPPILPGPLKCHPLYKDSYNLLAGNHSSPDPRLSSHFSLVTHSTLYIVSSVSDQTLSVWDWSFSDSFLYRIMNPCNEPQKISTQEISFLLTNSLPLASSCLSPYFCQKPVVKFWILLSVIYVESTLSESREGWTCLFPALWY